MSEALIDRIYETAFVPDQWPAVLDDICAATRSASGAIQIIKPQCAPLWAATDLIRETLAGFIRSGQWQTCERPQALFEFDPPPSSPPRVA